MVFRAIAAVIPCATFRLSVPYFVYCHGVYKLGNEYRSTVVLEFGRFDSSPIHF